MVPTIRPSCSANATNRCSMVSAALAPDALVVVVPFVRFVPMSRFAMRTPSLRRSVATSVYRGLWGGKRTAQWTVAVVDGGISQSLKLQRTTRWTNFAWLDGGACWTLAS
jgi:hypothetical protein